MEQVVILLIMAAIALLNWAFKKKEDAGEDVLDGGSTPGTAERERPTRRPPAAPQGEEERVRRFMEALGIPQEAATPPPAPPQAPPPIPRRAAERPLVETVSRRVDQARERAKDLARQAELAGRRLMEERVEPVIRQAPPVLTVAAEPRRPIARAAAVVVREEADSWDPRERLHSADDLRAAIVLSEILGPPKALQRSESLPGLR